MADAEHNDTVGGDISADDYDLAAFKRDLFSGKMRVLASILAVLNAGYLAFAYLDTEPPEMHFPIHLRGNGLFILFSLTLLLWLSLAIINWVSWAKNKRN